MCSQGYILHSTLVGYSIEVSYITIMGGTKPVQKPLEGGDRQLQIVYIEKIHLCVLIQRTGLFMVVQKLPAVHKTQLHLPICSFDMMVTG